MSNEIITDGDRYPDLSEQGRRMLQFLKEHPHAPIFRNESGHRLTSEDLEKVRRFEKEVASSEVITDFTRMPGWLDAFIEHCFTEVPFYRRYGAKPSSFESIPTISRADLSRDIAQFVPDSVSTDRMINFQTSGTTGHFLLLPSHPVVAASYLAFHKKALRRFGIGLTHGAGQVGVVLIGFQQKCFTYVSVTPLMNESGLAKINLHPDDWRHPDDPAKYLDALEAEVYTGDPISLSELAKLPLQSRSRAILSTSMTLLPELRRKFEERFGCVVLDLYSMNEAGPIAVADERTGGHVLLQHRMLVEILDPAGRRLPPGERGEVTLTGGFNFCLPLLRYRTGDFASLEMRQGEPVLMGLEGRPPVRFRTMRHEWINNIEVTHTLKKFAIPQFALHQDRDGALFLKLAAGTFDQERVCNALLQLFGAAQRIKVELLPTSAEKLVQYTSDLRENQ